MRSVTAGRFVLVAVTQAEPDSSDAFITVRDEAATTDETDAPEFRGAKRPLPSSPGFAFFRNQLRLPVNGRWVLVVTGGTGRYRRCWWLTCLRR